MAGRAEVAWFDGWLATDLLDRTDDPAALDSRGWWAAVCTFEGELTFLRFGTVRRAPLPAAWWRGPARDSWRSSLSRSEFVAACARIREHIRLGDVYQVNLCRLLTATAEHEMDAVGLARVLGVGNPAPFAGVVDAGDVRVVTASPELFLRRTGRAVRTGPIKGTGRTAADLGDKDAAENIMIVDLARNDLSVVCDPSTVRVPDLLRVEEHPGLVHLVSTVTGELDAAAGWAQVLAATMPPASVSGVPKRRALEVIADLEPGRRGPYCGAVGYVDADARTARLAVGIRTFWLEGRTLRFGSGAGITWGSDPQAEWEETELKAERLLALASGPAPQAGGASAPVHRAPVVAVPR